MLSATSIRPFGSSTLKTTIFLERRFLIVELRVPAADVRRPIGMANGVIDLPQLVWDAYCALEAVRFPDVTG